MTAGQQRKPGEAGAQVGRQQALPASPPPPAPTAPRQPALTWQGKGGQLNARQRARLLRCADEVASHKHCSGPSQSFLEDELLQLLRCAWLRGVPCDRMSRRHTVGVPGWHGSCGTAGRD